MRIGVWLSSLSLLASLAAQDLPVPEGASVGPPLPEAKLEVQCNVEGTVVNAKTKDPVGGAHVRLTRMDGPQAEPYATTTDASGRFKLSGLPPGEYQALAARNGFVRQVSSAGKIPPRVALAPKQTLQDLTLALSPAAIIAGRVVDELGEPLPNVKIQPFRYVGGQAERQLAPMGGSVSTDDQGAYRMFGLEAGRYYLSAAHSVGAGLIGEPGRGSMALGGMMSVPDEGYAPVFYPGVAEPSQAGAIQLHAGEERRGVDFRLTPVRSVRVRGRVNPVPARPWAVVVFLAPRGEWGAATFSMGPQPPTHVDSKGAFEIRGVLPGAYTLAAMWNREGNPFWGIMPLEAGAANIDGLELTLKPAAELKGRVRFDGQSPPGSNLTSLIVRVTPVRGAAFGGPSASQVDAEGSFKIHNMLEGDYRVTIGPLAGDVYLKAVKYAGVDAISKPITVGEAPGALELVLAAGGGRVEGVVTDDGKPTAGALVVVELGGHDPGKLAQTDRSGRFSVRGLAPGDYTVYACDVAPEGFNADPIGPEVYQDKAQKITVAENERATADLTLIHTQVE